MKKLIILLVVLSFGFIACSTSDDPDLDDFGTGCTPDGLWYYYEFGFRGPYEIRIKNTTGHYEKIGSESYADKAMQKGFISSGDVVLKNIIKIGERNGNNLFSAEFRTFNLNFSNGDVTGTYFDPVTIEVRTLNTSAEPCNTLFFEDASGNLVSSKKIAN